MVGPVFVLFDIDGTLLAPTGLGKQSLDRAFQRLYGTSSAFDGVRFHGRTDPDIFQDGLSRLRLDVVAHFDRALAAYLEGLAEEVVQRPPRTLPGVQALLRDLRAMDGVALGLVTGNVPRAAEIKLAPDRLNGHFQFGGFGGEATRRAQLIDLAVKRARSRHGRPSRVLYIGDTELDVLAAREAKVTAVGVATGGVSKAALEASEPDHLFDDLAVGRDALLELCR